MTQHVLIVDNAVHRRLFKPSWHWKAHMKGIDTHTINAPSAKTLPSLCHFTHVLLTGSEASILDHKPWFDAEAELIREALARGTPTLGSCFGHHMLVYALAGRQYLRAANPPEVGWADVERTGSDPLFDGLPNPWQTFVYHFDEAFDPPAPWIRLGKTKNCETHLLRYGTHPIWGIQAHPEISSHKARFFLRATLLMGRKPVRHILHTLRNAPPRNDVAATVLSKFLDHEALSAHEG